MQLAPENRVYYRSFVLSCLSSYSVRGIRTSTIKKNRIEGEKFKFGQIKCSSILCGCSMSKTFIVKLEIKKNKNKKAKQERQFLNIKRQSLRTREHDVYCKMLNAEDTVA